MGKTFETSENATKDFLKTHYYKCMKDKMLKELPEILNNMSCEIVSIDKDYDEISVNNKNYEMTLKICMTQIGKTSVDLFINSYFLLDFSKTIKVINDLYDRIAKKFVYVGSALNKGE